MRDHIVVYVNGRRHSVRGKEAFLSLAEFLRDRLRLTGTKVVCSEGDCGSCSVLVGRLKGGEIEYRAVDSCIQFLFQLDGTHIVTIEGLRCGDELTPLQQAMVTHHGSQCGYCTPGFVVAMTGLLERRAELDEEAWRCGLTGNLCRCTGYASILEAGRHATNKSYLPLAEVYPAAEMTAEFRRIEQEPLAIEDGRRSVFSPVDLSSTIEFLAANPNAKIVAGGTDVGVQLNKRTISPSVILDLNRVAELTGIELDGDAIVCGARVPWVELEAICRQRAPEFGEIISIFGSPQIRHVGTIGGNIVNASPIADSLPFLFVTESELKITGPKGLRTINIHDFYRGYRKTDLKPGELLTRVRIPLPTANQHLSLYKISRRRDLDIATFTAAILLELSGEKIADARIALGAVGPTVLRARQTEAFLRHKTLSEAVMQAAGNIAADEISPIGDVRGSADFRRQLTRNIFLKWYHEFTQKAARDAA